MKNKSNYLLHVVFFLLVGLFIIIASYFLLPYSFFWKRSIFPYMAILAIIFFLLGGVLIYLTLKNKLDKGLKIFLLVTGISASSFLVGVLLHNFLYGLGIIFSHIAVLKFSMEVLHVAFFFLAVIVSPAGFLVGSIGSIVKLIASRK